MSDPISLRDYVDGRFKETDARLTALEGRVATSMADQAHATERSIDGLNRLLGEINRRILDVEMTLAGLKAQLTLVGAVWSIVLIAIAAVINLVIGG